LPVVVFCALNPSTAGALKDDPTARKFKGFAKAWGYGGFWLLNLYALRSTDPDELLRVSVDEAVGPENDAHILGAVADAAEVVLACGSPPPAGGGLAAVAAL